MSSQAAGGRELSVSVPYEPMVTMSGFYVLSLSWARLLTDRQEFEGVGISNTDVVIQVGPPVEPTGQAPDVRIAKVLRQTPTSLSLIAEPFDDQAPQVDVFVTAATPGNSTLTLRHSPVDPARPALAARFALWPEVLSGLPAAIEEHLRRMR